MLFPFVHHQLVCESLWIVIPYSQHHKLSRVVEEMTTVRVKWLQRQQPKGAALSPLDREFTACLSSIPFYSKNLFPPLSLLDKHDVQYYRVPLKAGQVLMAHGGFAHYGFSTSKSETYSLASNMVTEEWFRTGGPQFLVRYFEWVKEMQRLATTGSSPSSSQSTSFEEQLQAHGITFHQLANALNLCPPSFSCALLRGMKADLRRHLNKKQCVATYTLDPAEIDTTLLALDRAHSLLHEVRPFLERFYVDSNSTLFQVCSCQTTSDAPAFMDDTIMSDDDTRLQSKQVRAHHTATHRLPADSPPPTRQARKLDVYVTELERMHHMSPNMAILSVVYQPISGEMCRCWYVAVAQALRVDSFWHIHQAIRDAVACVSTVEMATDVGFLGDSDLNEIKRTFLRSTDFKAAQWATDLEVHLLSLAYRGAVSFLIYRDEEAIPTPYRYSGVTARPTGLVEIALHWCTSRRRGRRPALPNHYNLLLYNIVGRSAQPFWWIDGESNAHMQARREQLRQAVSRWYASA